ncbi:MAG: hypothetical protein OEZ43_14890 [Gammaproteobacteria bacterium]|nr:hypothetical protein [Gammaproteobacteria bacterium]
MKNSTLHLLLPHGLYITTDDSRDTPVLDNWYKRGDSLQVPPLELGKLLFQLLGIDIETQDVPVAAFENLALTERSDGAWFIKARPINLVPDRAHLVINDGSDNSIAGDQEKILISGLNEFFKDNGLQFIHIARSNWHIRSNTHYCLRTSPFIEAITKKIVVSLFEGDDARLWINWNNEMQMWLHSSVAKSHQNASADYNSLWLWGSGVLPSFVPDSPWDLIVSDNLFVRGVARWLDVPVCSGEEFFDSPESYADKQTRILCVPGPDIGTVMARFVDSEWITPINDLLMQGRIKEVVCDLPNGIRIAADRSSRWRFWRSGKGVSPLNA